MDNSNLCAIDSCGKIIFAKGYCSGHYARMWRHGDPLAGNRSRSIDRICEVDGCTNRLHAKGLCTKHYLRKKKHGVIDDESCRNAPGERWIKSHAQYNGDDCLEWPFSVGDSGRGVVMWSGVRIAAPRAMCIAAHGYPQNKSHQAAHSCGNGHLGCMNPNHLRWATHAENVEDRAAHGRDRKGEEINTAKLTESDVRDIRSRSKNESCAQIAKEFGVTKSTIVKARNGRTWAWLDRLAT